MMDREKIQSYFDDVLRKLWPKWQISDEQMLVWAKQLRHFDYAAVKRATEEHFTSQEGSYGRPKLYAIIARARNYQSVKTGTEASRDSAEADKYEPDVFVQCVEHESTPGYVKSSRPVFVPAERRDNCDYIMKAAENMRHRFETCYGGRWIIVQQSSYAEMQQQFLNHRAKQLPVAVSPRFLRGYTEQH